MDVRNLKIRDIHQNALSSTPDFLEDTDRDVVAQAYNCITQFLHRYKNNIEFVTKEELVAVTNIKESTVEKVLDKLKKVGVLSVHSNENNEISPYICYYINKGNLKNH